MIKKQVLKIASILNKFTIDDIANYVEDPTDDIIKMVKTLCEDDMLKQVSDTEYVFVKPEISKSSDEIKSAHTIPYLNNVFDFEKDGLFDLKNYENFPAEKVFQRSSDLVYYDSCTAQIKPLIIKQIILFLLIGDLTQAEVQIYIKSLMKNYPDYKMNAQWYKIKLKRFIEEGVPGLFRNQLSNIDNGTYEIFKKLYLSPKRYSQDEAYAIMKATVDDDSKLYNLATYATRLRREYSKEAIKKMRNIPKQEEINEEIKNLQGVQEYDKPETLKFEIAANNYWDSVIQNNLEISKTKQNNIKKLKDYFGDFLLGEIVYSEIQKYRNQLLTKGVPIVIARALLQTLAVIMRANGVKIDYQLCNQLKRDISLFTLEEIKEIIKENTPQTWIIALGLKVNELDALCYEDIDFDTREVTISKRSNYGKMHFFKKKDKIRRLKIPVLLLNKLNRNKKGRIFKDVYVEDYEKYLYAHIMLMQSQNVSMNIICKNMGFKSLRTFEVLFGHLFPQELDKDFDIFKNISYRFN